MRKTNQTDVVIHTLSWKNGKLNDDKSLEIIQKYSPYKNIKELMDEFDEIETKTGTPEIPLTRFFFCNFFVIFIQFLFIFFSHCSHIFG